VKRNRIRSKNKSGKNPPTAPNIEDEDEEDYD